MNSVHPEPLQPEDIRTMADAFFRLAERTSAHGLQADAAHDRRCSEIMLEQMTYSAGKCRLRSHYPAHLTGSLVLVSPDGLQILMTHHRKLGKWLQLGGHLNAGELPEQAALREAEEESGFKRSHMRSTRLLDIDTHPIPARSTEAGHIHLDVCYMSIIDDSAPLRPLGQTDESHEVRWVPLVDLTSFTTEESLLRKRRKLRALLSVL